MVSYRSSIDGLRAMAVLSVVLFHCGFARFAGGYVGVDIFFVISGYLITQKIYRGISENSFAFRDFYLARMRRLFPALLATVALTMVGGALIFTPEHFSALAQSAIYSILAASNIYFWSQTGYWDLQSNLKPLLHVWSLSVEEQFYLVWPLLLLCSSRLRHPLGLALLFAIVGASVYFAGVIGELHPSAVFYLMPFRAFEFAAGAILIGFERYPPKAGIALEIATAIAFGLIVWPILTYTERTRFPVPGALYVCVGTAMLIYAGSSAVVSKLWDNAPSIWIGRISYSLYLVHWPLIVFYLCWRGVPPSTFEKFGLLLASIAAAVPLHYVVERRYRYPHGSRSNPTFLATTSAIACLVIGAGGLAWGTGGWNSRRVIPPEMAKRVEELLVICKAGTGICPGATKVALIGDSHANHIVFAVAGALQQVGLTGTAYKAENNCILLRDAFVVGRLKEKANDKCHESQQAWRKRIEEENPETVILASFWIPGLAEDGPRLVSTDTQTMPSTAESRDRFKSQITETIDWLIAAKRRVVIIGTSPMVDSPPSLCYERPGILGKPDCSKNQISDPETHLFVSSVLRTLAETRNDVLYIDLASLMCKDSICPLGEKDVSFYHDQHHLNVYGEAWVLDHAFGGLAEFLRRPATLTTAAPVR